MTVKQYRIVRAALLVLAALVAGVLIVGGVVMVMEAGFVVAGFILEAMLGWWLGTAVVRLLNGIGQQFRWGAPNPLEQFAYEGWQEHGDERYGH